MKIKIAHDNEIRVLKTDEPTLASISEFVRARWPELSSPSSFVLEYEDEDSDRILFDTEEEFQDICEDKLKIFVKKKETPKKAIPFKIPVLPSRKRPLPPFKKMDPPKLKKRQKVAKKKAKPSSKKPILNYKVPEWSCVPEEQFWFEIIKDGISKGECIMNTEPYYLFGRDANASFTIEHPHCSRQHAVVQFNGKGECFIFDLGSRHGTSLNNQRLDIGVFVQIYTGDKIVFGRSQRAYFLQGNPDYTRPIPEEELEKEDNEKTVDDVITKDFLEKKSPTLDESPKEEGKKAEKEDTAPLVAGLVDQLDAVIAKTKPEKKAEKEKIVEIKKEIKIKEEKKKKVATQKEPVFFKKKKNVPSFLETLRKKHKQIVSEEITVRDLPFKSDASIETFIRYADHLEEHEKAKCMQFKKKTKKLGKLDKYMDKLASKGEQLGKREEIRQKKEQLELDLSSLEDQIRNSVFRHEIQRAQKFKQNQNSSLDARVFDDDDDFYDRAKVVKKRKKINTNIAVEDMESLNEKKSKLEILIEETSDEGEKRSLSQELVQIRSRIFQLKMKIGMPPKKKRKTNKPPPPQNKSSPKVELKSKIKLNLVQKELKTDADGFKIPSLVVKKKTKQSEMVSDGFKIESLVVKKKSSSFTINFAKPAKNSEMISDGFKIPAKRNRSSSKATDEAQDNDSV